MEDIKEIAHKALSVLDLTSLNDGDTEKDVIDLCAKTVTEGGSTAAVCVWPKFVALAKKELVGTGVKVATVTNFPHGSTDVVKTVAETKQAVADGADEVDVVFPYKAFMAGDKEIAHKLVKATKEACGDKTQLKVIIESGELKTPELIAEASAISIAEGANFIKTSTGKSPTSATLEAAETMLNEIKKSGKHVGFKASGGIKNTVQAGEYMDLAERIMGDTWVHAGNFRFGASSILTDLLNVLGVTIEHNSQGGY